MTRLTNSSVREAFSLQRHPNLPPLPWPACASLCCMWWFGVVLLWF